MLLQPSILSGTLKNSAPIFINSDKLFRIIAVETGEKDRGTLYSGRKRRTLVRHALVSDVCCKTLDRHEAEFVPDALAQCVRAVARKESSRR